MRESEAQPGTRVVMRGPLATPGVIVSASVGDPFDVDVKFDDGITMRLDPRVLDAEPVPTCPMCGEPFMPDGSHPYLPDWAAAREARARFESGK